MNEKQLARLGVPPGEPTRAALAFISRYCLAGHDRQQIPTEVEAVIRSPAAFVNDELRGGFAQALVNVPKTFVPGDAPWKLWGGDLDPQALSQMSRACQLPVSVAGALMPDAHVGYGLPIGGVLATEGAVIPYAVGVDIACRMKLTVLDWPVSSLSDRHEQLIRAIESETRFGVGATFKGRRQHEVMDANWAVTRITRGNKDRAWAQLGTSGSGNHFVEFGTLKVRPDSVGSSALPGLTSGEYLALLSHSGSRGTGAAVCDHFSKLAMAMHPELPKEYRQLAWLALDSEEGAEYWAAMELMGQYAAANHALIHRHIAANLGAEVLADIENHHNFAWKEHHVVDGSARELVVHRKGATPAGAGVLGIIPGSMATPGFVVRGKGNAASLHSASHGAGRAMSRTKAVETFEWGQVNPLLKERNVHLISAGLDEVPMVYKDIHQVMAAQEDLVEVLAEFRPRLVKMAPSGERPED
ncbi:MAG TPA: RtcB family protein [Verrucomicrobiota bacterium]|nr:RtcB family protein [Verrucomicrobiota bacterium]